MELREAVAMRVEDDHHRGVRDVDPDFDDRRRGQNVDLTPDEPLHHGIRPCTKATRKSGKTSRRNTSSSAIALVSAASDSSMAGATTKAWRPRATCLRTKSYASDLGLSRRTYASSGVRPGGISSITERSRSAYFVCASVRGIGVAVMCSVCGARL